MNYVLGAILILASIFLVVAVLMQSSKSHRLSGTIAGGAETFFGKTKGSSIDKKLSKLTTIVAIIFVVLVLVMYLMQDTVNFSGIVNNGVHDHAEDTVADAVEGETTAAAEDTAAPETTVGDVTEG
jgi:preprotein translocase subunit SecG